MTTTSHEPIAAAAGWTPLAGLRILDVARGIAGPFAARLLGDLGARVERLEPEMGDPLRALDDDLASAPRCAYDHVNAGKAITRVRDVAAAAEARLSTVDVLLCDLMPREQAASGLVLDAVRRRHPGLVVGSVTGYGLTGPDRDRVASELTIAHAGTEAAVLPGPPLYQRFPDRPPVRVGRYLAGYDAGQATAAGVVAALVRREATGAGDLVEVAAVEVQLGQNRTTISRGINEGEDYDRSYRGYGWQGTLAARDGWVCLRPNEDRQWRFFVTEIGRSELADDPRFATYAARFAHADELQAELERWTRTVDRATVRAAMVAAGVPGGPYLEPHEILVDEVICARAVFEPWPGGGRAPRQPLRLVRRATECGDAMPQAGGDAVARLRANPPDDGPLSGLRVLDLTWVAAGPYATMLLRSLGADVLKIESPNRPDLFRRTHGSEAHLDEGLRFVDLNQGKRSVALDLKNAGGLDAVRRLAAQVDIVVENYRPGVRDRLGLGDEVLLTANPRLVIVSLSGYGATAPDRDRPGYASVFSAESGISTMTGYPDAPPTDVRDSNDLRGGTATFLGAVAGLLGVLRGHGGVSVEAAMREALICLQGDVFLQASRGAEVTRMTNEVPGVGAAGCYLARDGRHVAVGPSTREQERALGRVIAANDVDDPGVPLAADVAAWAAGLTTDEVVARLRAADVPVAVTASVLDVPRDRHLTARGVLRSGTHPRLGRLRFVAGPIRSHAGRMSPTATSSPLLGEHTDEVLEELLGLEADTRAALDARRALPAEGR